MPSSSQKELDRKFRVLQQILGIHSELRDRYKKRALLSEITLLGCSVVFCTTVFAGDDFFQNFGIQPSVGNLLLGFASVLAFFTSLVLLLIDLKGNAARHGDAADKWTSALSLFRETRQEDGTWADSRESALNKAYWDADHNSVKIPDRQFNSLKARYLLKVEMSRLQSTYPGCPRLILWCIVRFLGSYRAIHDAALESSSHE